MAFTDDFTDTDGVYLENHTPSGGTSWTLASGSAGAIVIGSNALKYQAAAPAVYICDDQGSANQYTQITCLATSNGLFANCYYCTRLVDADNFIGFHEGSTNSARLAKNVAGVVTDLVIGTTSAGNIYQVKSNGTTIQLFENGAQVGTDQTVTDHQSETSQGIVAGDSRINKSWDDFEAGTVTGATTLTPSAATLQIAGYLPDVRTAIELKPGIAQIGITGYQPSVTLKVELSPARAALRIVGYAPTITTYNFQWTEISRVSDSWSELSATASTWTEISRTTTTWH